MNFWRVLLAALFALCWAPAALAETFTFGVVPQFEQRRLFATWRPMLDYLERETGHRFVFVTAPTITDFDRKYNAGEFDFAYMNPYYMVSSPQRYLPLVRDRSPLYGVLVARKDGAIHSPADLQGKEVAYPAPNALGASLLMRADLDQLFHVKTIPRYTQSHSSVYLLVAQGIAAAGGGVVKTLEEQKPEVRDALKVIYQTRSMPSHPMVAHERVPPAVRDAVRNAILRLPSTPEGRALLAPIPMPAPVAASQADYEPMRAWGLDAYYVN